MRYCGRKFTPAELGSIRALIAANPKASRAALSRHVCELLQWYRPDGRLKDMSCRVAMLRMQDDGLLQLPPPRNGNNNGKPYTRRTERTAPKSSPVVIPSSAFAELQVYPVQDSVQSHLWNEYIQRYHYLGYAPVPGDQIRYIVWFQEQVVALLSFRAAVWKTAPRDQFIGWSHQQRKDRLHLVINNARFLILPWIQTSNLASRILSMTTKRVVRDWVQRYHYSPVLVETFVESRRFTGTCYKAANWLYLGKTKGVGRLGITHKPKLPIKSIWVYPLHKNFRHKLCS
ncbi:MAG: DUF4338 domain-containing protein [Thermodesulfobacteriota bacterium]|nr:DUF4338 domain-containing protein [Thermodesulfobacteriota bacterium]